MHTFGQDALKKLYGPILCMGLNCLQAAESLQGDSSLFTTQSSGYWDHSFNWLWKDKIPLRLNRWTIALIAPLLSNH